MPTAIEPGTAAALGAIQGLTEFLPVSSSGHIAIGELLFGLHDAPLTLSIVLHLGTLIATIILFAGDLKTLILDTLRGLRRPREFAATDSGRTVIQVVLATIPTVVVALLLKDRVESWQHVPWIVGICLIASAGLVSTTRVTGDGVATHLTWKQALVVGLAQGVAVLPGISRSGTTIAVAMMMGMQGKAAFRFSFLLSLPAVAGAVILELSKPGALAELPWTIWLGGGVALVVGLVSLVLLRKLVDQGRFWAFAIYLVPVGAAMMIYGLTR